MTGNLNVAATLITQNVIPDANVTYDLGTSTARFKDLWLSNSTIYLGEASISAQGGNVSFGNAEIQLSNVSTKLNVTNDLFVSGNVGIGTASPEFTFETVGTVGLNTNGTSVLATFGASNNTDKYLRIRNSDGNFEIGSDSNGHYLYGNGNLPVRIFANGVNSLHVTSGGNIGIGTTNPASIFQISSSSSPQARLHFSGSASSGDKGSLIFSHNRNSDGTQELLGYIQAIAEDNQSAGGLRFVSRNNTDVETFRITSAGRVGIRTTSPTAPLQVAGEIRQSTGSLGTPNTTSFRNNIETNNIMTYFGAAGTISTYAAAGNPHYVKKFFLMNGTVAGALTQTLMQIDSRGTGFNELWVKVIWGTRIQGISDAATAVNERAYGANKFNGLTTTYSIAENWNHVDSSSNTHANIQLVNSGTGGVLDLNYVQSSSVLTSSFVWGYIEVFSVEEFNQDSVKIIFNC
jgi:hypothetical protein